MRNKLAKFERNRCKFKSMQPVIELLT